MIGLLFIVAAVVYLVITIVVIRLAVRWAKRRGRRPVLWGIVAAFIMYNLVFWDFIPTYALYKYYCNTKAGFWVYKTPEQWKAENPGVAETLTWRENPQRYESPDANRGYRLNERFVEVIRETKSPILPVRIYHRSIIDLKNSESVVQMISVSAGYMDGRELLKFWVNMESYIPDVKGYREEFTNYHELGREL